MGRMTIAGIALATALVLPSAPASAQERGHRTCASPASATVYKTKRARVFAKTSHGTIRYYGCLFAVGRKWHLARVPKGPKTAAAYGLTLPTVRGRYVAFAERSYRAFGDTRITVVNLRTGAVRFRSTATRGEGGPATWTTTALVVTATGEAAWIDAYRFSTGVTEVRAHDRGGDVLLDRGVIRRQLLLVHGATVTWAHPDGSLTATLR